jgi:hypothetical protein
MDSKSMNVRRVLDNLQPAITILRQDISDSVRALVRPQRQQLTEREASGVESLRKNGFAVFPEYWPRDYALRIRDLLEAQLAYGKNHDYEGRAYLRFWDERSYDQGVRRLYHVEDVLPELKEFRHDPFVFRIVAAYYGIPLHSGVLVFQHNTKTNANTRYYHIDQFGKEFKAFLYLDDVDEGNGPLAYLRGSHRRRYVRLRKQIIGNPEGSPTSFYDEDLGRLLKDETPICAPAGTLILADVRGFHRGLPQQKRSRSVLVNYIVGHPGDLYLDK